MSKKLVLIFSIILTVLIATPVFADDEAPENLARKASTISASSEYDTSYNAYGIVSGLEKSKDDDWASKGEIKGAWLQLDFDSEITAGSFIISPRPNGADYIVWANVEFNDSKNTSIELDETLKGYVQKLVVLDNPITFTSVKITLNGEEGVCMNIGLDEFEIYASNDGIGENLSLNATILASSTYSDEYAPSKAISGIHSFEGGFEWASQGERDPDITLYWDAPITADTVCLYDRISGADNVFGGTLLFFDENDPEKVIHKIKYGELPHSGTEPLVIEFPERTFSKLMIGIDESSGPNIGLYEVEIYYMNLGLEPEPDSEINNVTDSYPDPNTNSDSNKTDDTTDNTEPEVESTPDSDTDTDTASDDIPEKNEPSIVVFIVLIALVVIVIAIVVIAINNNKKKKQ